MGKIARDVVLATAEKQIEEAEQLVADAHEILLRLAHSYPELAPTLRLVLGAQDRLSGAMSRIVELLVVDK